MKKNFFVPCLLTVLLLSGAMVGCSDKHERAENRGEVIEKSTTTTIERPVMQENKRTTTTTTETQVK